MSGVAQPYSRRRSPENGQLPGFLDVEHQNIQRGINGAEGLITLPSYVIPGIDTSTYLGNNAVFNVEDFGATPGGIVASKTAIQNAVEAAIDARNGIVLFPNPPYAIEDTITIGDASNTAEGIQFVSNRLAVRSSNVTLKWIGATGGDSAMLSIRNAHSGAIRGLGFDAANKADYCVQIRHVPGDLDVAEHWDYHHCSFMAARKYNALIGEADGTVSSGDASAQNFHGCFFRSDAITSAATTAHVRIRSGNTFAVNFWGTQFSGSTNPTYNISMDSGWANVYGGLSVGIDNVDVFLETAAGGVPPCICVYGWESQSTNFMRATLTSSMQRSSVLSAVRHNAILGTPGDAIQWDQNSGHGGLVLSGCRFNKPVNIVSANARVWSHGTIFTDSTQTFTGHPEVVEGSWGDNLGYNHQIADGNVAISPKNSINQFEGTPVTVLVDGVIPLGTNAMNGFLFVAESGGSAAIYEMRATSNLTSEVFDLLGVFSTAAGTANSTNIYWSAVNSRYELENKRASTRIYRMNFMGFGG